MKIIFKKNFSPDSVELEVKATHTGKDLAELIAGQEKVDPQCVQLKFWGDVITPEVTVAEYKMKEGDTITYHINKSLKKIRTEDGAEEMEISSPAITLTLKRGQDSDLQVQVFAEDTIGLVRTKIDEKHDIPAGAIRLKYNNMMMFPAKKLAEYYIDKDVTLDMIVDEKIAAEERLKKQEAQKNPSVDKAQVQGPVNLKVKFHDGEEAEVKVDVDETMEELRKKLLGLKPISQEKEKNYRMKVLFGGEEAKEKAKMKELGVGSGLASIATVLERVKGENEVKFQVKRATGPETENVIIEKSATILNLKTSLEGKFNAKASEINLQLNGASLDDTKTVSESGVQDDCTVTISVIKKGLFSNK